MEVSYLGNFEYQLKHKEVKVKISQSKTVIESAAEPMIINGPGEYEVKGVIIAGFKSDDGQTLYTYDLDEIRVAYLGQSKSKLSEKQLDWLDGVDLLLVSPQAVELVKQIKPSIVIPIDNQDKAKLDEFIRQIELEPRKEAKLTLNKLSLPEETELVILTGK
ncbi:MAG: MBL fold metallo-hydrolase [Candidatus Beckwithbacteria bacterium]